MILIYTRPWVIMNKDFFHDDVFSCVFRLFSQLLSTQKSMAVMKNFLASLEFSFQTNSKSGEDVSQIIRA